MSEWKELWKCEVCGMVFSSNTLSKYHYPNGRGYGMCRGKPLPYNPETVDALHDVVIERMRQDTKWGEQNHDPFLYLTVLMEEVGELAQAALHNRFGGPQAGDMRVEAVQVAAVALAIVECLDRAKWVWGNQSLAEQEKKE